MWLGRLDIYYLKSKDCPLDIQFPNKKACEDRRYVSFIPLCFSMFSSTQSLISTVGHRSADSLREYQRAKDGIVGLSEVNRLGVMVGAAQVVAS